MTTKAGDNNGHVYFGTSGLALPVPNKTMYPPEFRDKSRLTYYASLCNSIEINSSFQKLPLPRTVAKWADEVPQDFRFTFKIWKEITHKKGLDFNEPDISRFLEVMSHIGPKKGALLIQFPGKIVASYLPHVKSLLETLHANELANEWKLAVEFRDPSWYQDDVYQLLNENKAALVIHDMPNSVSPLIDVKAGFIYLRFHGPEKGYRGSYTNEFLSGYVSKIKNWLNDGNDVYIYFNNTLGDAAKNVLTLESLLKNDSG